MTAAQTFPNDALAVKAARQFALSTLPGYSEELLEVVELLVSELATNCVRHAGSGFELNVVGDSSKVKISVTDTGSGEPVVRRLDPDAVYGRGLALVEALASSWGVDPNRSAAAGKTVWFVLDPSDYL